MTPEQKVALLRQATERLAAQGDEEAQEILRVDRELEQEAQEQESR